MIYRLGCNRFVLLDDDVKKLAKLIKDEFGIDKVYRIEGDSEQIDLYAYDDLKLHIYGEAEQDGN